MAIERTLEQVLLADPRVQDVVVVEHGARRIAWVVPCREVTTRELTLALQQRFGQDAPEVALIGALPSTLDGEVDVAALEQRTPPSLQQVQRIESSLLERGAEAAAVLVRSAPSESFDPLEELLPEGLRPIRSPAMSTSRAPFAGVAIDDGSPMALSRGPARVRGPESPAVVPDLLRRSAQKAPTAGVTFIGPTGDREVVTYPQLLSDALALLGGLQSAGLQKGHRLIFQLSGPRAFVTAFWGCTLGGIIPVPLACPPAYDADGPLVARLLSVGRRLEMPAVLVESPRVAGVAGLGFRALAWEALDRTRPGVPVALEPTDTVLLSFTSGSTGEPKGVVLSHDNLMAMSQGMQEGGWHGDQELALNWMPLDHVAGICNAHLTAVRLGRPHVQVSRDYVLADILRWLDLLTEFKGTTSWAPNFAFGLVNDRLARGERRNWDLSAVRTLSSGGESLVAETKRKFEEFLGPFGLRHDVVSAAWGMAETTSFYTAMRGIRTEPGGELVHLGRPMSGNAIRIVDDEDRLLPERQIGHLQATGDSVFAGYLDAPDLNAKSFSSDGWFRTGNLALISGGSLVMTGREKEVIIIGGNNVYPHEVEGVVDQVPGVVSTYSVACATRAPGDQTDGIVVFFAPAPEAPPLPQLLRDIRETVGRVLGYAVSYFVPLAKARIPRTELGKKGRTELKRRFEQGEFAPECREVAKLLGGPEALPRCLYVPRWVRREQVPSPALPSDAVVVVGSLPFGESVQRRGQAEGRRVIVVEPGSAHRWSGADTLQVDSARTDGPRWALEALAGAGLRISDLVLEVRGGAVADEEEVASGIGAVLGWIKMAAALASTAPLRLIAALRERQGASFDMLVPGLLWSAQAEVEQLDSRVLWLPDVPDASGEDIWKELQGARRAREVAFRAGQRWERTWGPWRPSPVSELRTLRQGGLFLVTGGARGLGLEWARQLRHGLGARLVLVGRRPRSAELERLEVELGQTMYVSADVTDANALEGAIREAEERFGQALAGAFHFAGIARPCALEAESGDGFADAAAAHVLGAVTLASALRRRPEVPLFFASSLMGVLGAARYAAYCSATGFVTRYAESLRADGRQASTVCFSGVRGTGMGASFSALAPGYRWLERTQSVAAVGLALEAGAPELLAGVDGDAFVWREAGLGEDVPLEGIRVFVAGGAPGALGDASVVTVEQRDSLPRLSDGTVDREALLAELSGQPGNEPQDELERSLAQIFCEVLGAQRVDTRSDFFDLGGSSLQASRMALRVGQRLGIRVLPTAVFEYPSVGELAAHLRQLAADGPQRSAASSASSSTGPRS